MKRFILLISEGGKPVAQALGREWPDAVIVTNGHLEGCRHIDSYETFLQAEFAQSDALIFVGAMGICIRLIAP